MLPEMLQRLWDAASTGFEILTSSFASVGDKRQRDALAHTDGGGSAAPTRLPLTEHAVMVNQHASDDPPNKRQRVREDPVAWARERSQTTDIASAASPNTSLAVDAHHRAPPPGPVFPHGRVDYTTARHVPRTSVTVGSRRSAFSPLGGVAGTNLSRDSVAAQDTSCASLSQSDRQLDAAHDQRQLRIYASLAQFEPTYRSTSAAATDTLTASMPDAVAGELLGSGFVPARNSVRQPLGARHWSTKDPAASGRVAGTDFRTLTDTKATPDLDQIEVRASAAAGSTQLGRSAPGSSDAAEWHSRAQRKAADKESLELYRQAVQSMNLAQYDLAQYDERRRERESRMKQLEAHMLERKQNQDAEAQRGRAAETQKVQMLENASKIAKREFDERMAEKQLLRRAQAEAQAAEEERRRQQAAENSSEHGDADVARSGELDSDEAISVDDAYGGSYDEDEDDDDDDTDYPTITDEQKANAQDVMDGDDLDEIIQSKMMGIPQAKIDIKRRDLQCLRDGEWLNDEVINVWMDYVKDRNQRRNEESAGCMPTIYIMKTMFYSRMCVIDGPGGRQDTFDYPGVRRWTKKVDVFAHDMIFIPLHQGLHWALAVVNMRAKRIQYFDSLGGHPSTWLRNIKRWMEEESMHKKQQPFDFSGWNTLCAEDCPQQHNGNDCGVFMCQFVKHTASHLEPTDCRFDQRDMPMIRWQMVHEIITGRVE